MPLTSVAQDAEHLTLTVGGDFPVSQQRLWDAFADPRQLERFWGPPDWPATFTRHDLKVGGRSEYFLSGGDGERWSGSWRYTAVDPISSFEALDGEDNVADETMPSSMRFTFDTTPTGSRLTIVTWFSSVEAMEQTIPGMEEGLRAALPQLDALLTEPDASTKYVVTHRPESLAWGPSEGIGPDTVDAVRRLKAEGGPDLLVMGSSTLTSTLLEHGLADVVLLVVYPVLLGTGKRLFAEGTPARSFELTSSVAVSSGVIVSEYTPAGPLRAA